MRFGALLSIVSIGIAVAQTVLECGSGGDYSTEADYIIQGDVICENKAEINVFANITIQVNAPSTITRLRFLVYGGANVVFQGEALTFTSSYEMPEYSAAALYNEGDVRFENEVLFYGCSSHQQGGAIENRGVINFNEAATFTNNESADGGAIVNFATIVFSKDATFNGNSADYGAAFDNYQGTMTFIRNAVFQTNIATDAGGAFLCDGTLVFVGETLFQGNSAPSGAAVFFGSGSMSLGGLTTFEANIGTTVFVKNIPSTGSHAPPPTLYFCGFSGSDTADATKFQNLDLTAVNLAGCMTAYPTDAPTTHTPTIAAPTAQPTATTQSPSTPAPSTSSSTSLPTQATTVVATETPAVTSAPTDGATQIVFIPVTTAAPTDSNGEKIAAESTGSGTSSTGLSQGATIGIVIGASVGGVLLVALAVTGVMKRRGRGANEEQGGTLPTMNL